MGCAVATAVSSRCRERAAFAACRMDAFGGLLSLVFVSGGDDDVESTS
jgi:hypothetical protein